DRAREALHEAQGPQAEAPEQEAPKSSAGVTGYDPNDLTRIPGAIGQFVDWVEADAMYPSRRFALGAALVSAGAAMSHYVMGPTGSGTHLYGVLLGPTGVGKTAPLDAAKAMLEAIGAGMMIVGEFRSSVIYVDTLKRRPMFLSLIDEFGDFLARLANPKAGSYETDIMNQMKQTWNLSYKYYYTPSSKYDESIRIFAPAPSILGSSTAENFYAATKNRQLATGFLNRLLVFEAEQQLPPFNPSHKIELEPPLALQKAFRAHHKPHHNLYELLKLKLSSQTDRDKIAEKVG